MDDTMKAVVGLIARSFVGWLAGGLVAVGLVQPTDKTMFITIGIGIITGLADYAWSWWQNKGQAALRGDLAYWKDKARKSAPPVQTVVQGGKS